MRRRREPRMTSRAVVSGSTGTSPAVRAFSASSMAWTTSGWLRMNTVETPARRATAAWVMGCPGVTSASCAMALNAAWRFRSDFRRAILRH